MNSNDGEATLRRDSFRGRFDAGEHRVGTVRIGLDFNRILIVHNVEPRTGREAWQPILLLFEPQPALAFLCVKLHAFHLSHINISLLSDDDDIDIELLYIDISN